jgi:AraC-like DNA-binding protein
MSNILSTDHVHPRDRLAYWVDIGCNSLVHADCSERRTDEPFFGEIRANAVGAIRCVTYSSVGQTLIRSPRIVARHPADAIGIGTQITGEGFASQDGRDTTLRVGDLTFYDMSRPFQLGFRNSFVRTTLLFPREALLRRVGRTHRVAGRRIDGTKGLGALLLPLVRDLPSRAAEMAPAAHERVANSLLDLIATALLSDVGEISASERMPVVHAKVWIEAHLGDPLSTERIAGACRVSARHLNRMFDREGASPMRYVWERRLARCHRDLTDPTMSRRSVSDIAFSAGFNDLSHFSRAYRARYGCTPRETRLGSTCPVSLPAA